MSVVRVNKDRKQPIITRARSRWMAAFCLIARLSLRHCTHHAHVTLRLFSSRRIR